MFDHKNNDEKNDAIHTEVKNNGGNSDTTSVTSVDQEKGEGFQQSFVKSEAEKRLVRKITFTIMPLICWIIIVQVITIIKQTIIIACYFPSLAMY